MRHFLFIAVLGLGFSTTALAQVDKDQLALEVSKVDAENINRLKEYVWKLHSVISGEGGSKTTLISEFQFDEKGELQVTVIDGETNIEQKKGARGKAQQSAMQSKLEYVGNAMKLGMAYTYMTKGQLLDFFDKAEIREENGVIVAVGKNVYVQGDELTIRLDAKTKFFLSKSFTTKMGSVPVQGELKYATFESSGVNHVSTIQLKLPTEHVTIDGENKDYTIRVR